MGGVDYFCLSPEGVANVCLFHEGVWRELPFPWEELTISTFSHWGSCLFPPFSIGVVAYSHIFLLGELPITTFLVRGGCLRSPFPFGDLDRVAFSMGGKLPTSAFPMRGVRGSCLFSSKLITARIRLAIEGRSSNNIENIDTSNTF